MKININKIPEEGLVVTLDPKAKWVKELLHQSYPKEQPVIDSVQGKFTIRNLDGNLHIDGKAGVMIKPTCDRCGEDFDYAINFVFNTHLLEAQKLEDHVREQYSSEIPLDESVFFTGTELDFSAVLGEQFVLALPLKFLCKSDCKGLCTVCGVNRNTTSCPCVLEEPIDPRWAALKSLKNIKNIT